MANTRNFKSVENPFFEEDNDDIDDATFLNHPRQGASGYMLRNGQDPGVKQREQMHQQVLEERRRLENSMLQSSHSSLRILHESEQIGISTAEELVKQGEQLRNVERKVDNINSTMKVSQKHLNSMKSIFGNIRNYFNRGTGVELNRTGLPQDDPEPEEAPSALRSTLDKVREESTASRQASHPAYRIRGMDTSGFGTPFDEDEDNARGQLGMDDNLQRPKKLTETASRSEEFERRLASNLDEMSMGVGRLKSLAVGLGDEMDEQMEVLENINDKVYKADGTIQHQNSQMRRILKK